MTQLEKIGIYATVVGVFFSIALSAYNTWDTNRKYEQTQQDILSERRRLQSIDLSNGYADLMEKIVDYTFSEELSKWDLEEVQNFKDLILKQYSKEVEVFNTGLDNNENLLKYYSKLVTMRMNFNVLKSTLSSNLYSIKLMR